MDTNSIENSIEKFLTFLLAEQEYAVRLKDVQEIKGSKEKLTLTKVLHAPPYLKGLLEVHHQIIPVIDLKSLYGIKTGQGQEFDVLLIINVKTIVIGLMVDNVLDIIELQNKDIKPSPDLFTTIEQNYIDKVGTHQGKLIMILNIEKLLEDENLKIHEHFSMKEKSSEEKP